MYVDVFVAAEEADEATERDDDTHAARNSPPSLDSGRVRDRAELIPENWEPRIMILYKISHYLLMKRIISYARISSFV